jgi:hypothetical protein
MPQLFSPRANMRLWWGLVLLAAVLAGAAVLVFTLVRSGTAWGIGTPAAQPIPFSHALHAGGLGTDCRFCHATVERAADAGMPSAELCLACHSQVWTGAAALAPLRDSVALNTPIEWHSVHRLPDHARFDHSAHVTAGVACETCHGQVWTMPRTVKVRTMSMGWCLDCHRAPEAQQRPPDAVFDCDWHGTADPEGHRPGGAEALRVRHFGVEVSPLTRCSTCHK